MSATCELITGASESFHISSVDDAHKHAGIFGPGNYVMKSEDDCSYSMPDANTFYLHTGDLMMQGRHIRIPEQVQLEVTTNNASYNRIDAIVCRYFTYTVTENEGEENETTLTYEDAAIEIKEGTPTTGNASYPSILNGDMMAMAESEMVLYYIIHTGSTFTVVKAFTLLEASMANVALAVYPVGAIYMSVSSIDPSTIFGGTWEQIQGCFLFACDTRHPAGLLGGEEDHVLTSGEMPSHTHTGPSHTHTGPSHTHTFTTGNQSANHTHGSGNSSFNFSVAKPISGNAIGRRKVASGSSYHAITSTGGADDLGERSATGANSANHTHSGTTAAAGTGNTGASGTGNTGSAGSGGAHNNMPPYLAVYMWKRTA